MSCRSLCCHALPHNPFDDQHDGLIAPIPKVTCFRGHRVPPLQLTSLGAASMAAGVGAATGRIAAPGVSRYPPSS